MNAPASLATFVRIVFFKDVRARRYPLLLLFVASCMFVLLPLNPTRFDRDTLASSLGVIIIGLGIFLLLIPVIQSDPAGREFRFLLTRPVPGVAVALAKALFLILFVFIPYWLGSELLVAYAHIPLSLMDHLLLFIQVAASFGAALAGVILACVFLPNGYYVLGVLIGLTVFQSLITGLHIQHSFHWPDLEHERFVLFRTFLGNGVFLFGFLIAIQWRYRSRRFWGPLAVAATAYGLSFLASFFPYDLARGLHDQSSARSMLRAEQLRRIHMVLVQRPISGIAPNVHSYSLSGGEDNGEYFVNLNQPVRMDGLMPPYFIETVGYHAVITLRSGKKITSNYADFNSHGGVGGLTPELMTAVANGRISSMPQGEPMLDLMTYTPNDLANEDLTSATIKGVIILNVRRAFVAGTMPLRPGAFFNKLRRRYEIKTAEFSKDRVSFEMDGLALPLALRGDLINWNTPDDLKWIPFYQPFGVALQSNSTGSNGWSGTLVQVSHQTGRYTWPIKAITPNWRPCPSDWANGTEIEFIGSDSCGQIELPYEIDNVDLHYRF